MQRHESEQARYCRIRHLRLFCVACVLMPALAQVQPQPETAASARRGFSVREASVYSSYYSFGLPPSLIAPGGFGSEGNSDVAIGGSTVFAFARPGERTNFSLQYTPSYTGRLRYSEWSGFGSAVNLQFDHSMTSRLRFSVAGNGAIRNREELQFGQIAAGVRPSQTATGSPYATALGGEFYDTAAQSLFFGGRVLAANVYTGIQYSLSPRLSLTVGAGVTRTQYLRTQRNEVQTGLIPRVTAFLGDVGLSYNLTPRTSISGNFGSARQESQLQKAVISDGRFSIGRAMTQNWFVSAYGGVGQFRSLQRTDPTPTQLQYIAGGGITYRSYSHIVIASFDRRISDMYGVGATNTRSLSGSWRWAPPRARAWLAIGFGRTELQSLTFPATTWRGTGEVGYRIAGNIAVVGSYAYLGYSSLILQSDGMVGQSAVRIGLTWIPRSQVVAQP